MDAIPDALGGNPYQIIIFDNGSPKDLADEFYDSRNDNNLKVIRSRDNLGFPVACNRAADQGYSPFIFFLNSDVILSPGSVGMILQDMMNNPRVGIAGMKLLFPESTDLQQDITHRPAGKVQHVGIETNIRAELYHIFLGWNPDHPKVMAMWETYAVTGAALLTRRPLFKKAGGFDPIYGAGTFEDVSFCMEVRRMGYDIIVNPKAIGVHHTGATAEKYRLGYDLMSNRSIFLGKWKNMLEWTDYLKL